PARRTALRHHPGDAAIGGSERAGPSITMFVVVLSASPAVVGPVVRPAPSFSLRSRNGSKLDSPAQSLHGGIARLAGSRAGSLLPGTDGQGDPLRSLHPEPVPARLRDGRRQHRILALGQSPE